jgi:hypothetical protein
MTLETRGTTISEPEVTNISKHGFWLILDGTELFLSFEDFPWFAEATVAAIMNVHRPAPQHLYWPDLDIDLELESISHPERYPMMSKI